MAEKITPAPIPGTAAGATHYVTGRSVGVDANNQLIYEAVPVPSDEREAFEAFAVERGYGFDDEVAIRSGRVARGEGLCPRRPAALPAPFDWRELARRLYVELFHCDQQMCSTRDEDGDPTWATGATVRDVLRDAKAALEAAPAAQAAPQYSEADHFLAEIGEHSIANCPWMRALEIIENAIPAVPQAGEDAQPAASAEPFRCPHRPQVRADWRFR